MTTILGLRADRGKKVNQGIILGSDISITHTEWKEKGSLAVKELTKSGFQKMKGSRDGRFIIGTAGVYDNNYYIFLDKLLTGKYDVEKIIAEKDFQEFRELNINRWGREFPNGQEVNEFLIASRFDNKPKLHRVFPLGKVEEYTWCVIASGSPHVTDYFKVNDHSTPYQTMNQGIDLMDGALSYANKDIYTVGFDIAVVRPENIKHFIREIQSTYSKAKKDIIKTIKAKVRD